MDGDAGLRRDALAEVLAALTGDPLEWWNVQVLLAKRITPGARAVVCEGAALSAVRRDGGVFWTVTDTREAMELLQVRGLAPEDDERRGFDVRRSLEKAIGHMPPMKGGSAAADGFVIELIGYPENWQTPTVELRRGGIARRAQMADTHDESHPRYSVESTTLGLAAAWPEPGTIPDLVAYASLGRERIATAEALAWHGAHMLTLRPKVLVWRVSSGLVQTDTMLWQIERMRVNAVAAGVPSPCDELYAMGILWVSGDDHAVVLCIPPVGSP